MRFVEVPPVLFTEFAAPKAPSKPESIRQARAMSYVVSVAGCTFAHPALATGSTVERNVQEVE
jgi:hypothetical protein